MKSPGRNVELLSEGPAGEETRSRVGRAFSDAIKREWYLDNVHLGYRYLHSPVIIYEDEDPDQLTRDASETAVYTPTTQPGRRAPHAWLADGLSTHDHFGRSFVLVDTAPSSEGDCNEESFVLAARERGIPLEIVRWQVLEIATLYQVRYVLVRPDDTVAWRGDALPEDIPALLSTVSGH
jgi:hypothetical protein